MVILPTDFINIVRIHRYKHICASSEQSKTIFCVYIRIGNANPANQTQLPCKTSKAAFCFAHYASFTHWTFEQCRYFKPGFIFLPTKGGEPYKLVLGSQKCTPTSTSSPHPGLAIHAPDEHSHGQ